MAGIRHGDNGDKQQEEKDFAEMEHKRFQLSSASEERDGVGSDAFAASE